MIKVYHGDSSLDALLLGMELSPYQRVDSALDADVIVIDGVINDANGIEGAIDRLYHQRHKKHQVIVVSDLWHGENDGYIKYHQLIAKFKKIVSNNHLLILSQYQNFPDFVDLPSCITIMHYDIMFNRQKAYFSQLPFRSHHNHQQPAWYWAGNNCYNINHWPARSQERHKIFLAANRYYYRHMTDIDVFRIRLTKRLLDYRDIGYVSHYQKSIDSNACIVLYSHREDPITNGGLRFDVSTGEVREQQSQHYGCLTRGFAPPHLGYYEDTFISIYSESVIDSDTTIFITEKTFNPLMQCHFILPYGSKNTIARLQAMGFLIPGFIDYSYDSATDNDVRRQMYMDEVDRLLTQTRDWWIEQRENNLDLLYHNRRLFWTKDYDQFLPLCEKILQSMI